MPTLITLFALLSLSACSKSVETTTTVRDYEVQTLFTHEDCTAYRFSDGYRHVYYVRCGSTVQTQWDQPQGKSKQTHRVTTEVSP